MANGGMLEPFMSVRLELFGAPSIIGDGAQSTALPFERRSQLLAFLALRRSWVGRAELASLLWPEQETKLAYTNLRKTLFRLQSAAWAPSLDAQGGALRFEVATDVADFEAALRERRLADAIAFRRGELLAGFEDDGNTGWSSWLAFERDRLRAAWRGAALDHLTDDLDPAVGVGLSARLLDHDPLDEAALRAYMSWLARSGQGALARQAYRAFAARLADDLGVAPSAELSALHDAIAEQGAPRIATPRAACPDDAGFVGRAAELRTIVDLLAKGECRLVSLLGPGGVGKTRLAQRAMNELAASFADGAVFVPLDDVATAGELPGRVAREFGVKLAGSTAPIEQVAAFLREREMLLVLDNFEQLAAHAPLVQTLLAAAPRVRAIVTTRVRLGIAAEWLVPLDGLPCPEAEDRDRVESFDAARLFVQAARRVEPALAPQLEADAIVDICRAVGGLPLALEIAAAWIRVLSCEAIAAELSKGSELLHAVDPARPPRHASIEVVFDQSWHLLSGREREALARLSMFRGGFAAEAARAVTGASLPVLAALADKSLLRKEGSRMHLHPLVAQLAARRLSEGEARHAAERAHALYHHREMAERRRAVEDGDRDALSWMERELENCRAAFRWSIAQDDAQTLARSIRTLLFFYDHRGRFEEGLALFQEGSRAPCASSDGLLGARLLAATSHLAYRLDRYAEAEATAERAQALAPRDRDTRLQCLKVLAACALRRGRHADAKRFYRKALAQAPASLDPHGEAALLDNLALVEKELGRYEESIRLSHASLAAHRRLGDAAGIALCLNNLGAMYFDLGRHEAASAHMREALVLTERHGLVSTRGLILANLTEHAIAAGDLATAATYAERALEIARAGGNRAVESWLLLQLTRLALRSADAAAARSHLASSLGLAVAVGAPAFQMAGVTIFAEILAAEGQIDVARAVLAFAAAHPSTSAPQREEIGAQLARLPAADAEAPRWPSIELPELVDRIVVESGIGHRPLIAALRGTR